MKKGIVMEQHRRYTIIMTREGTFQKTIPIKDAAIGAEVSYKGFKTGAPTVITVQTRLLVIVPVLVLLLVPFYLAMDKNETYAYVNVDVNPSIELVIDENLDVDSIRPINRDATKLVNELTGYQDTQLDKVISMIMKKSEEAERINEGKNMLVGFSYMNKESNNNPISDNLKQLSAKDPDWEIVTFRVPKDVRDTARKEDKSMNEKEKEIIHTFYHTEKDNHSEDDDKQ
ncbi:hypothetical protein KFZ58_06605 [Virgibacillus sp. NKC19-16]|uniref:anti-sigma-I factor RsgI family protein n=1 Tax=Virgibacillus salidurans TaxID=2831673 RepID=UPI001F218303|nr:hypothetical protein [Virgibacillus sp. NKC19-16]UJL47534.1 hypothetical protein KFZ58_06605 [Virgibacillus sp. NKC19-16]